MTMTAALRYYYLGNTELRKVERTVCKYNSPAYADKTPSRATLTTYKLYKDENGRWAIPEDVKEMLRNAPVSEAVMAKRQELLSQPLPKRGRPRKVKPAPEAGA